MKIPPAATVLAAFIECFGGLALIVGILGHAGEGTGFGSFALQMLLVVLVAGAGCVDRPIAHSLVHPGAGHGRLCWRRGSSRHSADGAGHILVAGLVLGLINAFVRPVLVPDLPARCWRAWS